MAKITNPWVGYFDRSFQQIKDNVLTKFQALVPEITDHTETNPWVKGISIWSGLIEMIGYYIDNTAREVFITQAQEYSSAVKIAKMFDYRIKGRGAASVDLTFLSDVPATADITIPQYTKVSTSEGIEFLTTEVGVITTGATNVIIPSKQIEIFSGVTLATSDGSANQAYSIETNIEDNSVTILVGAQSYIGQDTFAFSFANDTHFVAGLDVDQKTEVVFGDDINGNIPPSTDLIVADYNITLGEGGNVGAGKITTIIGTITVPSSEVISVSNVSNASGGSEAENLEDLRKNIPISIRTKYRAVTKQDFIDLSELVTGVEKAGVLFDCDVSNIVGIYIAPNGGGAASSLLITTVKDFLELRKIITTKLNVETSGEIKFIITADVIALPGTSNATVKANVEQALLDFLNVSNQEVFGALYIGDIFEILEGVTGVDNSNVTSMIAVPHARPLNNSVVMNWTRTLLPASTTNIKWLIRFISTTQFEIHKDNQFIAVYDVDTLVTQTEISFTVIGTYTTSNDYEFWTYPYNKSVVLSEPSIPTTDISLLTINVTGGV